MGLIPVRFTIFILGVYACALVYMHRAGMSVAIVSMTTAKNSEQLAKEDFVRNQKLTHECVDPNLNRYTSPPVEKSDDNTSLLALSLSNWRQSSTLEDNVPEFDWNEKLQGIVLGAQFYLYIFVPTFAGRATDAIGGRWIAFIGVLGPCVLAAITPVATKELGVNALIVIRTLLGGFHGCIYAALFSLYVKWFPIQERSNANAGLVFGGSMGSTIMYALAGYLCETSYGWPLVFYVLTLFHVPWLVLWLYYATNEPANNPRITEKEFQYIKANVQEKVISKKIKAPWLKMSLSVPVVCSLVTKMCSGFGYFLLLTKMPSYLSSIFGISIFQNGTFNAATTFSSGMASLVAAPLANILINRFKIRKLIVRKLFQSIAMFGPAICLGLIPAMGCRSTVVICLLVGAMLLYGFFTAGEWTIVSEYAPNFAGTVFGFANILAFATGVVAPYVVGVLLDDTNGATNREQWNLIFYITVGIYLVGGIAFLLFGTDKQQDWDRDAAMAVMKPKDHLNISDVSLDTRVQNENNIEQLERNTSQR